MEVHPYLFYGVCLLAVGLIVTVIILAVLLHVHESSSSSSSSNELPQSVIPLEYMPELIKKFEDVWDSIDFSLQEEAPPTITCPGPNGGITSAGPTPNYFNTNTNFNWSPLDLLFDNSGPPLSADQMKLINDLLAIFVTDDLTGASITVSNGSRTFTSCLNDIEIEQAQGKDDIIVNVVSLQYLLNHLELGVKFPQMWIPPASDEAMMVLQLGLQGGFTLNVDVYEQEFRHYHGTVDITFATSYPLQVKLKQKSSGVEFVDLIVGEQYMVAWDITNTNNLPEKIFGLFSYQGKVGEKVEKKLLPKITTMLTGPTGLARLNSKTIPGLNIEGLKPFEYLEGLKYNYLFGVVPATIKPGIMNHPNAAPCNKGDLGCVINSLMQDETNRTLAANFVRFGSVIGPCQNYCGGFNGTNNKGCLCCSGSSGCSSAWCKGCGLTTFLDNEENLVAAGKTHVLQGYGLTTNNNMWNLKAYDSDGNLIAGPYNVLKNSALAPTTNPEPLDGPKLLGYSWFGNSKFPLVDIEFGTDLGIMVPGTVYMQLKKP